MDSGSWAVLRVCVSVRVVFRVVFRCFGASVRLGASVRRFLSLFRFVFRFVSMFRFVSVLRNCASVPLVVSVRVSILLVASVRVGVSVLRFVLFRKWDSKICCADTAILKKENKKNRKNLASSQWRVVLGRFCG